MRVLSVSVTDAGRAVAMKLPYERAHGAVGETVRERWGDVDAFVLMLAVGAAVRIVGPLLRDKGRDPAVICVDESASWAVSLCGGHGGGANSLAREVATLIGAEPVITTATDATGAVALDMLRGFRASGDIASVNAAILAGRQPIVDAQIEGWHSPENLVGGSGPERVVITDAALVGSEGVVALHPPSLVAGIGCSSHLTQGEMRVLLAEALGDAGLSDASLESVATIDLRAKHEAITSLGLPVRSFSAEVLSRVAVPNPSAVVRAAVGTPSVAEAAALLGAGSRSRLVGQKRKSPRATVALACRCGPRWALKRRGTRPRRQRGSHSRSGCRRAQRRDRDRLQRLRRASEGPPGSEPDDRNVPDRCRSEQGTKRRALSLGWKKSGRGLLG